MANEYVVSYKVTSTDSEQVEAEGAFSAVAAVQAAFDEPITVTKVERVRKDGRGTYQVSTHRVRP